MTVVVVGSANMDAVARVDRLPAAGETVVGTELAWVPGGKGANQAVAAARQGATTAFVGRVGDDEAGRTLVAALVAEGVDVRALKAAAGSSTGVAMIAVNRAGENTIVVAPSANLALSTDDVDAARSLVDAASVVVAQLEIPLPTVVRAFELARAAGATTVLNPSPVRELDRAVLDLVDVLVANEHEARALGDPPCPVVVITRGERGGVVIQGGVTTPFASVAVAAVDSTAAGDAFCGALAARMDAGRPVDEAVQWAAAAGALAVTVPGAIPSLPTRAAVAALLEEARS